MPGFRNVAHLVDSELDGAVQVSSFRKVCSPTNSAWYDLSMSTGNPKPNYYVGAELTATTFNGSNGIYHGQNVSPSTKVLKELLITANGSAALVPYKLLDYLMFYPLIDMDVTDPQLLDNTVTLPRYADGKGVQAMLVATNPYIGGQSFTISYTNQDGVSGRTSLSVLSNSGTNIGTLISSSSAVVNANSFGPFIPLQSGDTGIRSVQSITFSGSNGGLAALVLVKPIASTYLRELTAPHERNYLFDMPSLPVIQDGAYLNFIALPFGNLSSTVVSGLATFVWST